MKNFLLVTLLIFTTFGCLIGQSRTLEIVPTFTAKNAVFITEVTEFSPASEELEFVGLSCYHFDQNEADIFYRLKSDNNWSKWMKFDLEHEFVESSRKAYQTKPIEEAFSDIQFKTTTKLDSKLTVRLFLASPSHLSNPAKISTRSVSCELPEVCERDCWCPTCPIDVTPFFTTPTHLIVHHSAGSNQSNNFATVVEYIWDLHVNTNGWDDIGYNWLIDPNGILYEGRPDNYQGAHFSCINENTVGICVIGDYTLITPSVEALNTLVNLLAYEATEHDIDVNGQSYHVTGDFILDNVAGHRDSEGSDNACSATVCPGESFYPMLGDIRSQISELPCYGTVSSTAVTKTMSAIEVYPNPFHHNIMISSTNLEIEILEIIDASGRSFGFVQIGESSDLSSLKAGVYFLIYDGQVVEKIVKK